MQQDIEKFAARWRSRIGTSSGPSRVTTLGEAIGRYVRDKDTLYFGGAWARPA